MGKLKVSKAKKNNKSRGTSGIPNWLLTTLVIIVVLAVLGTCTSSFVILYRDQYYANHNPAVSMEDEGYKYEVNNHMMTYFFATTYNNFVNNYSSYISYFSIYDSDSKQIYPYNYLKYIEFNANSYDSMFLGDYDGTWFDYMMDETKESVKNLLFYCAEANALGIKLDDDDKKDIDNDINSFIESLRGDDTDTKSTDNELIANYLGKGATKDDLRAALELSALASKVAQKVNDNIENQITDDLINKEYDDNKLDYDLIDFYTYSFKVYLTDIISENFSKKATDNSTESIKFEDLSDEDKQKAIELYKAEINKAREKAAELSKITDTKEFKNWVVKYAADYYYDDEFNTAMKDLDSKKKPSEDALKTIKEKMIAKVIEEVLADKTEAVDDVVETEIPAADGKEATKKYTIYDIEVSSEFAKAAKTLKTELFNAAVYDRDYCVQEKINYVAPTTDEKTKEEVKDKFSEWAFSADRKVGDITAIEKGDNADNDAIDQKNLKETFSIDVSLMTKTAYKDESVSKSIAYMMFETEADAKAAIEAIKKIEKLDKDNFLDAVDNSGYNGYIEAYLENTDNSDKDLDKWLETAKVGDYTTTPITMVGESATTYTVAYYEKDITTWRYTVKSAIYNEKYTAYETTMSENYGSLVVFDDKVINSIG